MPTRILREHACEHHHAELVGAGFDRRARTEKEAASRPFERGDVLEVQALRARVVLTDHDTIVTAFGRHL
jgi:hypothetical protein